MNAFFKALNDHFLGVVLLLMVCGLLLGIIGTYISMFLLALFHILEIASVGAGHG